MAELPVEQSSEALTDRPARFPAFHAGDLATALEGAGNSVVGNIQIITVAGPRYIPLKDAIEVAISFLREYQASLPLPFHDDNPALPRPTLPQPIIDVTPDSIFDSSAPDDPCALGHE